MKRALLFAGFAANALLACNSDPEAPTLCMFHQGAIAIPTQANASRQDWKNVIAECEKLTEITFQPDEAVFIVHQLPEDVDVDVPLKLQIATPCTSWSTERRHSDGTVTLATRAPRGSDCFLTVTGEIANARSTVISSPNGDACTNVGSQCDEQMGVGGAGP